jgi:hypothetical protein
MCQQDAFGPGIVKRLGPLNLTAEDRSQTREHIHMYVGESSANYKNVED